MLVVHGIISWEHYISKPVHETYYHSLSIYVMIQLNITNNIKNR